MSDIEIVEDSFESCDGYHADYGMTMMCHFLGMSGRSLY